MLRRDIRYQAAIVDDHRVLLLYVRDRETGELFWLLPGGGREAGETAEECVCREMREETGLEVAVLGMLFAVPDFPGGIYDWLHTYHCRVLSGTARPGSEPEIDDDGHATIRDLAWLDLRDPAGWDLAVVQDPIMFPLLQQVRAALGYGEVGR